MSSHLPFDEDMAKKGRYIYSGPDAQISAILANRSQSRLIHSAISSDAKSIIDIGCGDGFYTKEFLDIEQFSFIKGIDLSQPAVEFAQSSWGSSKLSFESASVEDLLKKGEKFDLAVLRGVLHHAEDPRALLLNALDLADEVIVLEPNGLNPILKVIEKTSKYHIEHGERSFSPKKIENWVKGSKFKLIKVQTGVIVPFFCPGWFAKSLSVVEAFVEKTPIVNRLLCGANVFKFGKK